MGTDYEGLKLITLVGANPYLIACNYTKRHMNEEEQRVEVDCFGLYSVLEGSVVLALQSMTRPRKAGLEVRNFEADTVLCHTDEEEGAVYRIAGNSHRWAFSEILRMCTQQQKEEMEKISGRTHFTTVKYRCTNNNINIE